MFITALLGRIVCSERRIEMCSAGHCHPFRIGGASPPSEVRIPGSPPLGLLPELPARSHALTMAVHEWLVFFTDGLTESFNADDVPLDKEGVTRLLERDFRTASDVVDALHAGELNHRQQAPPHDDLTVLVFGFK
jgi:sigma-B regulation protein RsbU (phosphoserine phosphatase)